MQALVTRVSPLLSRSDRQAGQGLMEYGLILSLVSIFCILSLFLFGSSFASLLGNAGGLASYITNP